MGRSDDMMIIRGVNVFPSQIETVLLNEGYSPNYQIVVDRENNTDTLDINVELSPEMFSDTVKSVTGGRKSLQRQLKPCWESALLCTLFPRKPLPAARARLLG